MSVQQVRPPDPHVPTGLTRLADFWGLVLAYGLATTAIGVVLALWPGETLVVCAVLVAVQLMVAGVVRLVTAVAASSADGTVRVLFGVTGALALIVGLLCLRDPLQTLVALGLLLGAWWVVSGVFDVLGALMAPAPGRRAWDVVSGAVSVLAGGFLLVNPELSLGTIVVVTCVLLIAGGLATVVSALRLRAERSAALTAGDAGATTARTPARGTTGPR